MNKTIRNLIYLLMIASIVFFAGCTGKETTTTERHRFQLLRKNPYPL